MFLGKSGQSTIEALFAVLLVTTLTSLMFHTGVSLGRYIISEQDSDENYLLSFSKAQAE